MTDRIRYAVVGLGDYIAQSAVLPAFAHAKRNSVLSALVSDDPEKLDALGRIGEVRMFTSEFTLQVGEGDIRLQKALGGGALYDIGIYCINAARSVFQAEPVEGQAMSATGPDPRFREVGEMTAAMLRYPGDRLASFVVSFGAQRISRTE
jgi:predicted dehydrogenase